MSNSPCCKRCASFGDAKPATLRALTEMVRYEHLCDLCFRAVVNVDPRNDLGRYYTFIKPSALAGR